MHFFAVLGEIESNMISDKVDLKGKEYFKIEEVNITTEKQLLQILRAKLNFRDAEEQILAGTKFYYVDMKESLMLGNIFEFYLFYL